MLLVMGQTITITGDDDGHVAELYDRYGQLLLRVLGRSLEETFEYLLQEIKRNPHLVFRV